MKARTVRRVVRYVSRFGLRAGLHAARLHTRPGSLVELRLPGLRQPFWARAGTADAETFAEGFVAREYDVPFASFEPMRVLDPGANVGYASIYFANRWPRAQILAVEPAAGNIDLLIKNTRAWSQIHCLQAAVWADPTQVHIANPHAAANAYRMSDSSGLQTGGVPAHTIAQLVERLGGRRMDFLKMDVEGAEAEIFRNGVGWLDQVDVIMVELHDRLVPGCAQALYQALHGRQFRQEIVGGNLAIDLRAG